MTFKPGDRVKMNFDRVGDMVPSLRKPFEEDYAADPNTTYVVRSVSSDLRAVYLHKKGYELQPFSTFRFDLVTDQPPPKKIDYLSINKEIAGG